MVETFSPVLPVKSWGPGPLSANMQVSPQHIRLNLFEGAAILLSDGVSRFNGLDDAELDCWGLCPQLSALGQKRT